MPRRASRITLEVTSVRGAAPGHFGPRAESRRHRPSQTGSGRGIPISAKPCLIEELFEVLWESINGKGSWNANPWVWVVEFEKAEA